METYIHKEKDLPSCPFCKTNNWRHLQFGEKTNYFDCRVCGCVSPRCKTKEEAIEMMRKLNK